MTDDPGMPKTKQGVLMMHLIPPLIAAGLGAFVTVTVLSERMATIEERTIQSQLQMDIRFTELKAVVATNQRDLGRRIELIETRLWLRNEEETR